MIIKNFAYDIVKNAEKKCTSIFEKIEEISFCNQKKVLEAFQKEGVQSRYFVNTNGYGYDDVGRDAISRIFADTFGAEAAIVSPLIASGTHALTIGLFGVLRPGQTMLSISGAPYDTLSEVIKGGNIGSLSDFNISYKQVDLINNDFDYETIEKYIIDSSDIKLIFIGRSRGYEWRDALSIDQIAKVIKFVKDLNAKIVVMVDNCYGEFIDTLEPTDVGADLIAGSLIKNPGGGIAPTGGYLAGKSDVIEQVGYRMTAPSIGAEVGSYASGYTNFYQGFFMAPHVTANALKGSVLIGQVFEDLGFDTMPLSGTQPKDIIRSIKFNTSDEVIEFCRAIQSASPVDSNVVPYPWDMPGYDSQVIMAAGTFVQGASIELSADSPIREPYIAYLQGGLTYEHVKIATLACVSNIIKNI